MLCGTTLFSCSCLSCSSRLSISFHRTFLSLLQWDIPANDLLLYCCHKYPVLHTPLSCVLRRRFSCLLFFDLVIRSDSTLGGLENLLILQFCVIWACASFPADPPGHCELAHPLHASLIVLILANAGPCYDTSCCQDVLDFHIVHVKLHAVLC